LADELAALVPERPFGLTINEDDLAGPVDEHHRVRRGLE
jgi:hypothetical protein